MIFSTLHILGDLKLVALPKMFQTKIKVELPNSTTHIKKIYTLSPSRSTRIEEVEILFNAPVQIIKSL